jgi:hypothetical protein
LVVNPEPGAEHIEPVHLRDGRFVRLPDPEDEAQVGQVADLIAARVRSLEGLLGEVRPLARPAWFGRKPTGSTRFVGRVTAMWEIHSALHGFEFAPLTAQPGSGVSQIRGLGGTGKTLLAEEYALRFGAAYPGGVFWLRALGPAGSANGRDDRGEAEERDRVQREEQVRAVAEELLPGEIAGELKATEVEGVLRGAIQRAGLACLWVVDDLPDGLSDSAVRGWVAPHPLARTLFTTRSDRYGAIAQPVEPGLLSEAEAVQLLTSGVPANDEDEAAAEAVAAELGYHALAVDVAGAALRSYRRWETFAELLTSLLNTSRDALELAAELADELPGHQPSIAATLLESVEHVGQEGLDFLRLAALVDAAPIPRRLVSAVFAELDGLDSEAADNRTALALEQAGSQSLSERSSDQVGSHLVHTLVSRTVRFREPSSTRTEQVRAAAITALTAGLEGDHARPDWLYHARALTHDPPAEDEVTLLARVARVEYGRGDYWSAGTHNRSVWEALSRLYGEEHFYTLTARERFGMTLLAQGELEEAHAHLEAVWKAWTRLLGADDENTLDARNDLSMVLYAQGDPAARDHQVAVWKTSARVLGDEHSLTLSARNNLATTLYALGDVVGARAHLEAVWLARIRLLGAEHPHTLVTRGNLADTLAAQGDLAGARDHQMAVSEARARLLGEEHPDTLIARGNLATTLAVQGDLAGARDHQEAVWEASVRRLGDEHPDTLGARGNLAAFLFAQGDVRGAIDHQTPVWEAWSRLRGEEHEVTLRAQRNLFNMLKRGREIGLF